MWRLLYSDVGLYTIVGARLQGSVRFCIVWSRLSRVLFGTRLRQAGVHGGGLARVQLEAMCAADLSCKSYSE